MPKQIIKRYYNQSLGINNSPLHSETSRPAQQHSTPEQRLL